MSMGQQIRISLDAHGYFGGLAPERSTFLVPTSDNIVPMRPLDLNLDGRLDLVVANGYSRGISVFINEVVAKLVRQRKLRSAA